MHNGGIVLRRDYREGHSVTGWDVERKVKVNFPSEHFLFSATSDERPSTEGASEEEEAL